MSRVKKLASPSCLYSSATSRNCVRLYRHRVVGAEPTRYVVQMDPCSSDSGIPLSGRLAYADRSDLDAEGYTRAKFDDGNVGSVTLFLTKNAAAQAGQSRPITMPLRAEILGEQPPDPEVAECDLPDEQARAAFYAEVVGEIPRRLFHAPRGVWALEEGTVLVFGNDASPDDNRFEHEVATIRRRLTESNLAEDFSYAVSKDGRAWALLVYRFDDSDIEPAELVRMNAILWEAWIDACQVVPS